jgi:hypothetical protein
MALHQHRDEIAHAAAVEIGIATVHGGLDLLRRHVGVCVAQPDHQVGQGTLLAQCPIMVRYGGHNDQDVRALVAPAGT